ncbi:hypothetical protein LXL04_000967 [Taraxacum kok-saghyz]
MLEQNRRVIRFSNFRRYSVEYEPGERNNSAHGVPMMFALKNWTDDVFNFWIFYIQESRNLIRSVISNCSLIIPYLIEFVCDLEINVIEFCTSVYRSKKNASMEIATQINGDLKTQITN